MLLTNKDLSLFLEKHLPQLCLDTKTNSEALEKIFAAIGKAFDWQVGALWTVEKNLNLLKCQDVWSTQPQLVQEFSLITRQLTLSPGCDLPGRVWESQKLAWVRDLSLDKNSPRRLQAVAIGLRGGFCLPLTNHGQIMGMLEFFQHQTLDPDPCWLQTSLAICANNHATFESFNEQLILTQNKHNFSRLDVATQTIDSPQANNLLFPDNLTGLANRYLFLKHLSNAVGDQLLLAVARQLKTHLRSEDTIARLGNQEFAILLENLAAPDCALNIAARISQKLQSPFHLHGHQVFVHASIGIALSTSNYQRPEEILLEADTAMSGAQTLPQTTYQLFNPQLRLPTLQLFQLEKDLERAIERQEFQLNYQPIVSLPTRCIIGFEVLVRWQHPERGLLRREEFMPLAQQTGLIILLGRWVLREACRQIKLWQVKFPHLPLFLSVNISSQELSQVSFVEQIQQILHQTGLDPGSLKFEFSESILLENSQSVIAVFKQLQALGLQICLDNFGTGYSSLSYLHLFPLNTLKIAPSFIENINLSPKKQGIVRTILTLAAHLGMDVVVARIKQAHQLAQLKVLKCQYGQGDLFSPPLDSKAAFAFMKTQFVPGDELHTSGPQIIREEQLEREQLLLHIEHHPKLGSREHDSHD